MRRCHQTRPGRLAAALLAFGLLRCTSTGSPAPGPSGPGGPDGGAADARAAPGDLRPAPPPDLAPAAIIVITDDVYTPREVTIPVGGTVRWSFQAAGVHGVFPFDMGFPGSMVMRQGSYEHTFTAPGVYDYGCAIHGPAMPGKVTVK